MKWSDYQQQTNADLMLVNSHFSSILLWNGNTDINIVFISVHSFALVFVGILNLYCFFEIYFGAEKNINLGIMWSEEWRNKYMETKFIALNQLYLRNGCLCSHYAWTKIDWILRSFFDDCSVVVRLSRDRKVTIVIMYIIILAVFGVVGLIFKMYGLKSFKQNFLLPPEK